MRIAMWSGPRNLSTAMMYSFAARNDCAIWDEPFYAAYLKASGSVHPMQKEIMSSWIQDPKLIEARCVGDIPEGKTVFYQKHMTHHMLPQFKRSWIGECTNVFLLRHPARVIASYRVKRENPTLDDLGFRQQAELFDLVSQLQGKVPVVIDSYSIRKNPAQMLKELCETIGLDFQPAMLKWPQGGHEDDGPWAPHWYNSVWKSTEFAAPEADLPEVPQELRSIYEQAMIYYRKLEKYALSGAT